MKSNPFRDRMLSATRENRQEERALARRIAQLYERAAEDMAAQAAASKSGSLTERFALDLTRSLTERTRELWAQMGDLTQAGMQTSANRAVGVQTSFLDEAGRLVDLNLHIKLQAAFGQVADEAVAHVMRGGVYGAKAPMLSKRIWGNANLQSGKIEEIISQAVAKGESPIKLARALEAFVNPNYAEPDNWNDIYDIPFEYKIDYNAKRLAVTSVRHAAWGATLAAAQKNPYAEFLHWELTPAHVIYDICDIYAEHDEGLGIGNFSLNAAPLPHPWCTCLWYVDSAKDLSEIGRELRSWADGEREDERLDRAFGEWSRELGIANVTENDIIRLEDVRILPSIGARAETDYNISLPGSEDTVNLVSGTYIKNVEVFAGKGTKKRIREAFDLIEEFGGTMEGWQKVKGFGIINYHGEHIKVELHWYQHKGIGRQRMKIKTQEDGEWQLD